ncbi:PAS domain-containing sensor histidine kinase [Burkholderia sp. SRS-W-2-2016]|uniref:PAS domain-containing sensor histidine kinase n=1 Tax=Burkholderia sp. SRS-W-2-2016 TaxID=1926878 RepID=UPI00094AB9A4|nr:ATP-binding protein [Burkholderia sp. SRS-W-2-2016]OLL31972.1 PAS domain-containing sensor histidine kinase [Burkholderia sp. SRS-W-2-2016]
MTTLSESDFRLLLDSLNQCVLLHDAETIAIVWANRAACVALGYTLEELLPLKAHHMTRDDAKYRREIAVDAMRRSIGDGPQAYEWCYRSRTGVDMLSEAIATYVPLSGRPVVMVQFRDISAQEAMRRKLRSYEARLREYMQDLGEGVALITSRGKVAYLSESGRRVLGVAPDAPLGAALDYCTREDRDRLAAQLRDAPRQHPSDSSDAQRYRITRRDGVQRWLRISCRRVDIDTALNGVLVHFRDISDEVAVEETRRIEARMLEYAGRYNAMGEMATAIAHELSQPLAAVRNFVEGAIQRLNQPDAIDSAIWGLRAADRQAEHAALIIKSVREFVVKREPVATEADLRDVLAEVAYFIELRARDEGVTVRLEQAAQPLPIRCERVLIGQVILNLAFNAVEALSGAMQTERVVTLATSQNDGKAELHVIDNGPGVPDDVLDRLFEGFSSSKAGGNGIGLSLCKNIVARHDGRVWAQRAATGGLDCRFALPLLPRA